MITDKNLSFFQNKKMIKFYKMDSSPIWDKYRKESQQTICIIVLACFSTLPKTKKKIKKR